MPISLQSGIREYNGDLSQYTGMLGGLTPDIHTLRSLNPLTNNRTIAVMFRGPYFLQHYFAGATGNAYAAKGAFGTYKKLIEYYATEITVNMNDQTLQSSALQGGFAGRSIAIPTTQSTQAGQSFTIKVPELVGRPVANFHNMWIDGISDPVTGLTTYHGLVAGSVDENLVPQRIFAPNTGASDMALEPSPAWEVAEFLLIALDRSGARVDGALMALGCLPHQKVGNSELFGLQAAGGSTVTQLSLTYDCQFIQSSYVNDLATRYVKQFAVFGNSLNLNPGAGDAFFEDPKTATQINSAMFNGGKRPNLDAVQSGLGNAPVFKAEQKFVARGPIEDKTIAISDHSRIYNDANTTTDIRNPYANSTGQNG